MTEKAQDEVCPVCGVKTVRSATGEVLIGCGGHVVLPPEEGE